MFSENPKLVIELILAVSIFIFGMFSFIMPMLIASGILSFWYVFDLIKIFNK